MRQDLTLTVGVRTPRFLWFLVSETPCTFSGIAAVLLLIPMVVIPLTGGGPAPGYIFALDSFGLLSGLAALVSLRFRLAFLGQPATTKRRWAMIAWGAHLAAFVVVLAWLFIL